jgi:hypothetical protein
MPHATSAAAVFYPRTAPPARCSWSGLGSQSTRTLARQNPAGLRRQSTRTMAGRARMQAILTATSRWLLTHMLLLCYGAEITRALLPQHY